LSQAVEAQGWAEARERWPRRTAKAEKVSAALERFADWACSSSGLGLDVKLLMLFGSYADGTFRMDSDVDVLVVASGLPAGRGERRVLLEAFNFPARLQTFPYTPEEFIQMCRDDNGIAYSALVEGQVLHIDPEFKETLLAAL